MARKSDKLTPRQRQSQRIMREKKARKRRQEIVHKAGLIGGIVGAVALLGGGVWAWKSGKAAQAYEGVVGGAYRMTADAGFSLKSLYLDGRSRTPMVEIEKALEVKKGYPILRISLDDIRERLEAIPSVRFATVERELPGSLYVHIVEREPVALWQYQGKLSLVDDNGVVMKDIDSAAYPNLPLIVGEGAPGQVKELLAVLSTSPEMTKRFAAAVYVGNRRWNIRLNNGIEVKLPQENPGAALVKLAQLQEKQKLLDRHVKVIDLRVAGRLFIKLAPEDVAGKTANAKET